MKMRGLVQMLEAHRIAVEMLRTERPRKTLGFQTQAEVFSQCVASAG